MSKTIYRFFSDAEFKRNGGKSYAVVICDDDYKPENPFTDVLIPDELNTANKVPFYNPMTKEWTDRSADAQILQIKSQATDLAKAKQDAADAKKTVESLQADLDTATAAIVQLAQATLPSTDTETEAK